MFSNKWDSVSLIWVWGKGNKNSPNLVEELGEFLVFDYNYNNNKNLLIQL